MATKSLIEMPFLKITKQLINESLDHSPKRTDIEYYAKSPTDLTFGG
jgi:hypothetical protein